MLYYIIIILANTISGSILWKECNDSLQYHLVNKRVYNKNFLTYINYGSCIGLLISILYIYL